jgi:type I restriction enzyme, S subunit
VTTPTGWRESTLADVIGRVEAGVSVNSEDRIADNGESGILKTSAVTSGRFNATENKAILTSELDRAKVKPKSDRIIVSRMNTPNLVGASAYVEQDHENLYLPDRLWQLEPRTSAPISMRWLSYVLGSAPFRRRICALGTGTSGSMKNISKDKFLKLSLALPPLDEQLKIAEILSCWERAIETQSETVRKVNLLLVNLVNDLTAGKLRRAEKNASLMRIPVIGLVPKDWPLVELRELLIPNNRKITKPSTAYTGLGLRSHCKGTFLKPNSKPEKIALEELFEVHAHDLVVSITFAWEGAIAIAGEHDHGALTSHRFPTFTIKDGRLDLDFLRFYIRRPSFVRRLGLISPGGAGRNRVLSKTDFLGLRIPVPPLDEQRFIGSTLRSVELTLTQSKKQLDAFEQQRRGLLELLMSGNVRVKT